ncbi:DoxX family protein [Brevundimonas balnearis]|uniref:DoxX family protein n=1 Tax=Brevundimonas balnearis TaxID=1572858 RepID=A0ABV6R3M6_9CAUL
MTLTLSTERTAPESEARRRLRAFQRHLALWTLQAWLSMFFIGAAYAKLTSSSELMVLLLGWPEDVDGSLVRAIGVLELSLGIGIVAPLLTWRLAPVMAVSAIGLTGMTGVSLALISGVRSSVSPG